MNASNSPLLAHPKPEPLKRSKARADRKHAKARAICRINVYRRACGCCEKCGLPLVLRPSEARHALEIAHIHEIKPRSLGGSDTDPDNCECLCWRHHQEAHRL